jgi:hypothetical protein
VSAIEPLASASSLSPRARYLPTVAPDGYRVGDGETLAAAMHRLTTEQFTIAIDALTEPGPDVTRAATVALGALERIVAVLRLVRSVIGDEAYRTEVTILGDTSDRLDTLLTGRQEVEAIDRLKARYAPVLASATFTNLAAALAQRHQVWRIHALSGNGGVDDTLHSLRRARARFAAWPIEGDVARMYGREPIPDEFASIESGLRQTYKRGRRLWKEADIGADPASLVDWHAETRRLGHHLALLSIAWPEVVEAMSDTCHRLAAVLAEAEGLAILRAAVGDNQALCPDPIERSLLDSLVTGTTAELRRIAAALGARIYVEPTKLFMARLSSYWSSREVLG